MWKFPRGPAIILLIAVFLVPIPVHAATSSGAVTRCDPDQGYYSLSYGGWVHYASGACVLSTQVSAGGNSQSINFTAGASRNGGVETG